MSIMTSAIKSGCVVTSHCFLLPHPTLALLDGGPLLELDAVFRATTPPLLQEMTVVPPGIYLSHFAVSPNILRGSGCSLP
ncbi:hypothetical protein DFH09DRAFT_1214415 [Mycena vulgaris]|nr:hypothetical protein DFH09DRAFT_1214415 [Mycena vulgaris]